MPVCHMISKPKKRRHPMYYRIEIDGNLFGEWSLIRHWGRRFGRGIGSEHITLFNDMRAASVAADRIRDRMLNNGYDRA
ncbi:MAG: WGR domain-containing protein [Halocynthiibacter sp.]